MGKAQGLPINILVIGALAILVLVVIGGAFMAGGSNIFGSIARFTGVQTGGAEINAMRQRCNAECRNLDYQYSNEAEVGMLSKSSMYCQLSWNIPTGEEGEVVTDHCYGDEKDLPKEFIAVSCTVRTNDGLTSEIVCVVD